MSVAMPSKAQIYKIIDQLRPEQLAQLWDFVEHLTATPSEAALYHIHEDAVSTGIRDLADQHDRYLYSVNNYDAPEPASLS